MEEDCCCLLKYVFMDVLKPSSVHLPISTPLLLPQTCRYICKIFSNVFMIHSYKALY